MILLTHLVLVITFLHSVTADLFHVINENSNEKCFLLSPDNKVHLQLFSYTESSKDTPISLPFIFYRKKELNTEKIFLGNINFFSGSRNIKQICDAESIELGYCERKHWGKILYEYKNPEESKENVFSVVLKEVKQTLMNFYQVKEAGVYCMLAKGLTAESFGVVVQEVNGYSRGSQHYQYFVVQIIDLVLFLIISLSFTRKWVNWSSKSKSKLPYLIYLSELDLIFSLAYRLTELVKFSLFYHRISEDGWLTEALHWSKSLSRDASPYLKLFIISQYSAGFTCDASEQYEWAKLFGFCYFCNIIRSIYLRYISNLWKTPSFIVLLLNLDSYQVNAIVFLLYSLKTWMRYKKSVKSYHDVNKTSDPRLHQLRWFILGTLVLEMFAIILEDLAQRIEALIGSIPYLTETFLIDGSTNAYSTYWRFIPFSLIRAALNNHILINVMGPENYMKSLKYKISAD